MAKNEKLIKEIRERFDYCVNAWREIRDEARQDMKYVSGDPWSDEEKALRKGKRPALVLDELQQHINQTVNEMRVNKLAIKVMPVSGGAKPEHAQLRQSRIRQIEYESKAQQAYLTAYESMVQRSYGFFGITTDYCGEDCFDQKVKIRRFANPDAIYIDPDTKEADCSDMKYAFVLDLISQEQFKRQWPKAERKDFSGEIIEEAKNWIYGDHVQVAEYWEVEIAYRNLLQIEGGEKAAIYEDQLPEGTKVTDGLVVTPDGQQFRILNQRKTESRKVKQYITNGLEILEANDWLGKYIPIIPVLGKEMYVDSGAGAKRILLSRVRMARDPYMLYCAIRTAELEQINMTPKLPYLGYKGQFDTDTDWENINKVPTAYAEVKAMTDETGMQLLPLPVRQPYEPAIAPLEMAAEAAKRAIQSAFGSYNASIGKEDTHARSGVAIQALKKQSSHGTYHFVDNYVASLENAGRQINELLDVIEKGPRDVGIVKPDETQETIRINEPYVDESGEQKLNTYGEGKFSVVVSVGPSFQTEREEAAAFADSLTQIPGIFQRIGDLVIKLKNLGPLGDEMAKRLTPPDIAATQGQSPQQLAQKLGEAQKILQTMGQQLDMLVQERESKKLELESKEKIAAINAEVEKMKIQLDAAKTEATLRSKEEIELLKQEFARLEMSIEQLRKPEENAEPATA